MARRLPLVAALILGAGCGSSASSGETPDGAPPGVATDGAAGGGGDGAPSMGADAGSASDATAAGDARAGSDASADTSTGISDAGVAPLDSSVAGWVLTWSDEFDGADGSAADP